MVTWQIPQSCDNAPKQQWLIKWLQAWVNGEAEVITEPDVLTLNGQAIRLTDVDFSKLQGVNIYSVLTHGREGAIRAAAWTDEASGGKSVELMLFAAFTLGRDPIMKKLHILYTVK